MYNMDLERLNVMTPPIIFYYQQRRVPSLRGSLPIRSDSVLRPNRAQRVYVCLRYADSERERHSAAEILSVNLGGLGSVISAAAAVSQPARYRRSPARQ